MATIPAQYAFDENGGLSVSWALAGADTGTAADVAVYPYLTVQVSGTLGGASVAIEGGNTPGVYAPLTGPDGTPIALTAAGIVNVTENPRFIRAVSTGGTGATIAVALNAAR
jgi:hypothetical protein